MSLLSGRPYFKPFTYDRFYKRWEQHEAAHWLPFDVPMMEDVNDWNNKLTDAQRDFLTNIFRFFTQGDIDVAKAYHDTYIPMLGKLVEANLMLSSFAAREGIHIVAYSYLIESLGMPASTYSDFMKYDEMRAKQEYITKFGDSSHLATKTELTVEEKEHIAVGIALFSGFTEGMQLFSTFAMLLVFPLNGLMKGMSQIVSWSLVDESMHVDGMIDMFHTFLCEHPDIRRDVLAEKVSKIALEMVELERNFIKLVFARYNPNEFFGLTAERLERYIEYVADHRLISLGFDRIFGCERPNPLPELAVMINAPSHTNFFENTSSDYAKSSTTGDWSSLWKKHVE